jgi:hypothetical protein
MRGKVWVGSQAVLDADAFFRSLPVKPELGTFQIPPASALSPNAGEQPYTTAFSDRSILPEESQYVFSHDAGIVAAGRISYWDIFGDEHHTDFCRFRTQRGIIADCPQHNEIK